jgi:hypothetical protein
MRRLVAAIALLTAPAGAVLAPADPKFDHGHAAWTALVKQNVVVIEGGRASRARYAGFAANRGQLKAYLESLSRVTAAEFKSWSKPQQIAFLINAYNAFTVEKILTRYPDVKSIWDFGKLFGNPFKDRFFTLLGRESSLDRIEHELLRAKGAYDEPRVHFAVNCASIGCPMLREEAYVADRLDAQLEEQTRRFLSDRTRNRYSARQGTLEVSKIFDWYQEDWQSGYRGFDGGSPAIVSREQYFARYAALLADDPAQQKLIADGNVPLAFLDYDWTLNDAAR